MAKYHWDILVLYMYCQSTNKMGRIILLFGIAAFDLAGIMVFAGACCTPLQWQGHVSELTGFFTKDSSGYTNVAAKISYDYLSERFAIDASIDSGGSEGAKKVKLISSCYPGVGKLWIIRNGNCTTQEAPCPMREMCLPLSAHKQETREYGGKDKLTSDLYNYFANSSDWYATLSRGDCVPIGAHVLHYGQPYHVSAVSGVDFYNVTNGIDDPSVFNPPSSCPPNPPKRYEDKTDENYSDVMSTLLKMAKEFF